MGRRWIRNGYRLLVVILSIVFIQMLKLITRGLSLRAGVATLPCVTLFTRLHSGTCSSCAAEQHHIQAEIDPHFTKTYMDFQATTPVDPRVLDAMLPYLTFKYANPHSRSHRYAYVMFVIVIILEWVMQPQMPLK